MSQKEQSEWRWNGLSKPDCFELFQSVMVGENSLKSFGGTCSEAVCCTTNGVGEITEMLNMASNGAIMV